MMTAPLSIRALLFDLGGTLMYAAGPWEPILSRADQALARRLHAEGYDLDEGSLRARLHEYYHQRDKDQIETTYHFVLRALLSEKGYTDVAESSIRSALDALFEITQTNWVLEQDAIPTLELLKSLGIQLGILSNAGDDRDVHQLVERFGIVPYFDFVLTSAACYYRKPHPRSFELALARWNFPPEEAVMVGDLLDTDILGAQNAGMRTIWITRRAQFDDSDPGRIQPDVSLHSLRDIPAALNQFR
jgi:HAD superfamily hydrolase (TIGR01662 family)